VEKDLPAVRKFGSPVFTFQRFGQCGQQSRKIREPAGGGKRDVNQLGFEVFVPLIILDRYSQV
jgi:hypothetical protein